MYTYSSAGVLSHILWSKQAKFLEFLGNRGFHWRYFFKLKKSQYPKSMNRLIATFSLHLLVKNQLTLSVKLYSWPWFRITLFLIEIGKPWRHSDVIYGRPIKNSATCFVRMCDINQESRMQSSVAISDTVLDIER